MLHVTVRGTFCGKWGSLFGVACTWLARVLQVTSVSRAENLDNGMAAGLVFPLGPALVSCFTTWASIRGS